MVDILIDLSTYLFWLITSILGLVIASGLIVIILVAIYSIVKRIFAND